MHKKSKDNMKFTATIKKDDPEHPVVELKTTPWTAAGSTNAEADKDGQALLEMKAQLQGERRNSRPNKRERGLSIFGTEDVQRLRENDQL